jgi:serine protease inhibitor
MNHNISRLEQDSNLNIRSHKPNSLLDKDKFNNIFYNQINEHTREEDNDKKNNLLNSNKFSGEITGKDMRVDNESYGMPLRSHFLGKKLNKKDDKINTCRSDFDLYEEDDNVDKYKIGSYDSISSVKVSSGGFSGFDEVHSGTNKVIPELYGSDPGSFISVNVNKFTTKLNTLLQSQFNQNDKFCISSFSLFCIFSSIYIVSRGITETDIYDYFGMISKENIFEGLTYVNNLLGNMTDQICIKNMIFVSNEHDLNNQMVKYLSKISIIQQISPEHSDNEYKIINGYLKRLSNGIIAPISKKVIDNANILCLTAGYIKPKWKIPFTNTVESQFKNLDGTQKQIKMLNIMDTQFDYCEDNFMQLIEFKCIGDKMSMGIVLPKEFDEPTIKASELVGYIKELKLLMVDEVYIPTFIQQMKVRLSNIIYQNGIKTVFTSLNIPELIKNSESHISDIVQNITIVINNNIPSEKKQKSTKRYRSGISNIRFIADHPFIYYFRLIPTNTILLMGYY